MASAYKRSAWVKAVMGNTRVYSSSGMSRACAYYTSRTTRGAEVPGTYHLPGTRYSSTTVIIPGSWYRLNGYVLTTTEQQLTVQQHGLCCSFKTTPNIEHLPRREARTQAKM